MAGAIDAGRDAEKCGLESPGLVSDCRLMLSFARRNAFVLPKPLLYEIAWLDSVLRALKITTVSQLAPDLIWPIDLAQGQPLYHPSDTDKDASAPEPTPAANAPAPGLSPEEVILDVHSRLSQLIAPTTALSLQTSEPPAGKNHIFGGMPPLVQYVIVIAFISAVGFVVSASKIASKAANSKATVAAASAAQAFTTAAASAAGMASQTPSPAVSAPQPSGDSASAGTAPASTASKAPKSSSGVRP